MRPADLTNQSLHIAIDELDWIVTAPDVRNGLGEYTLNRLRDWAAKEVDDLRHELIIRQQIAKGATK